MKSIVGVFSAPPPHWVGDGFPVRTLFSYYDTTLNISPFLLLDHAGPAEFFPSHSPRGGAEHAHRGFETVTIMYQGELAHRDSTGSGGSIGPGDVHWMTAGSGILREELHSEAFTRLGGTLEMVKLWVNLPRREKMTAPAYQTICEKVIPNVCLPGGAGSLRLISGSFGPSRGPARTFTDIDMWDVRLNGGTSVILPLKPSRSAILVMLHGLALLNKSSILRSDQWALTSAKDVNVAIEALSNCKILILSGEPIDEPIVGHGPFVMNSEAEIEQAINDLQNGQFGQVAPVLR